MSWLDELSALEQRAKSRLAEIEPQVAQIEPLLAEYNDLKQLLERLSLERAGEPAVAATSSAKPAPRPARKAAARAKGRRAGARKPAAARKRAARKPAAAKPAASSDSSARRRRNAARPGERERQLLELVASRPGITVPQVATELGVDPTGLYGIVRRLQGKGQLNKEGTALTTSSPAAEAVAPGPSAA